ncbi:MAG: YlxR family protein [Streptosporangiaceae bacterium]
MPAARRPCKLDGGQAAPVRTCIGCGSRAAKSELIRVVAAGDEIVPDVAFRLPGRGAYLHRSLACWERAQRRKAFSRALRLSAALPADKVADYLTVPTAGGTGRKKADLQ